jgi:DNA-directed RNA polymerase subunit RPC12/RpoP
MGHVRGPFIEYECTKCGNTVQSSVPRNPDRLQELIYEKNKSPADRICAGCWNPSDEQYD